MSKQLFSTRALVVVLLLATVAGFLWLGVLRRSLDNVIGDEGTYMAMAASLAEDGDLRFDQRDRQRLERTPKGGRRVVILQQTPSGLAYSKPSPYALMAAPFQLLLGELGLVMLNVLALVLALVLAFEYARRLGPGDQAALTVVTFAGAGCLISYLAWRMSDSLQMSLVLAGLILCVSALRPAHQPPTSRLGRFLESSWAPWIGAVALGVAAVMRYPNALLGVGVVAAYLLHRRWRRGLALLVAFGLTVLAMSLVNRTTTGAAVPYKAVRASFDLRTGYPAGNGATEVLTNFETHRATQTMGIKPTLESRISAYASLYFFIGRHTGLLLYFPVALVLLGTALWRPDRRGIAILLAGLGMVVFYLVWMPRNYFGGEGFIGNRYFLTSYAALFVALPRLPRRRWLFVAWGVALVAFGSAAVSVISTRDRDWTSQSHAYGGAFRLLPYESIARAIDGRRDRYWSDEFQRFVDPFAEVDTLSFWLRAGDSPAEILVANQREFGAMRFVINTDAPEAILEYRDWRSRQEFELSQNNAEGEVTGVVEIAPSMAWRRHSFPFQPDERFWVRSFRLALRTPDGEPAQARVHYLGRYHRPYRIYDSEVLQLVLPTTAEAGTTTVLPVQVRNKNRQPWNSERVLPIFLSYILIPHEQGGSVFEGARTPLAKPVKQGQVLAESITIQWPSMPGDYDLIVDLRVEGVNWFKERNGRPLARGVVRVLPHVADEANVVD